MCNDTPLTSSTSTILIRNHKDNDEFQQLVDNKQHEITKNQGVASKWWQHYCRLAKTYRIPLGLADELLERLLFWMPHKEDSTRWREVLFGILSLHRLGMHCSRQPNIENSFGTSVQSLEDPEIQATSIRISLSVIHCIMPSLLEIIPEGPSKSRRQTSLRFRLEQIKFTLRLFLLVSYWKQFLKSEKYQQLDIGILRGGGMFHLDQAPGISLREANDLNRRISYTGRRTGLTLTPNSPSKLPHGHKHKLIHSIMGELLNILRPLYWASAEANHHSAMHDTSKRSLALLKSWFTTLVMDITSLKLLMNQRFTRNKWAIEEWSRRKNRLLLYLLRAPVWSQLVSPALELSSTALQKLPILGRLIDVCLWDWVLYWKLPYVCEEG